MIVAPEPAPIVQVDPQSLYRSAVADRLAGRPEAAVTKLEQVLAARPDDVDARLNLGLALLALDRLDPAEAAFRGVVERAPNYADAWAGLARIAQRRGDLAAARGFAEQARRAAPGSAEIAALEAALRPEPEWRVDVSAARSRLSGGLPDWTETRLSVSRRLGAGWTGGLAVEATERFDDSDVYLEGRLDRSVGRGSAWVAVGGAFDADYRPEVALLAGGQMRVAGGLDATLDASVARYPTGTVTGLHPGLAVDLVDGRVRLAARWINVWDENDDYRNGWAATARWQATERFAVRLGYADAPESSDGATVDVTAWNVGTDIGLTDRLVLRVGYLSEDRVAYDREELSLGLGWRF